jgi:hypothetical protein
MGYHMKHNTTLILFLLLLHAPTTARHQPTPKNPARAEKARFVIANLAQMIGQVGYIVENPHDAHTVGNAVSGMVDNIIKITVNAVQKKSINSTQAQELLDELFSICENFDKKIASKILSKKSKLYLL